MAVGAEAAESGTVRGATSAMTGDLQAGSAEGPGDVHEQPSCASVPTRALALIVPGLLPCVLRRHKPGNTHAPNALSCVVLLAISISLSPSLSLSLESHPCMVLSSISLSVSLSRSLLSVIAHPRSRR